MTRRHRHQKSKTVQYKDNNAMPIQHLTEFDNFDAINEGSLDLSVLIRERWIFH